MPDFSQFSGSASHHGKPGETIEYIIKNAVTGALNSAKTEESEAYLLVALNSSDSVISALNVQSAVGLNKSKGNETDVPAFDIATNGIGGVGLIRGAGGHLFNKFSIINERGAYYIGDEEVHKQGEPAKALFEVMQDDNRKMADLNALIYVHKKTSFAQRAAEQLRMHPAHAVDVIAGQASLNYAFALADTIVKTEDVKTVVTEVMPWHNSYIASAAVLSPSESPGFITHLLTSSESHNKMERLLDFTEAVIVIREKWQELFGEQGRIVLVPYNVELETLDKAKKDPLLKCADEIIQPKSGQTIIKCLSEAFMANKIKYNDYVGIISLGPSSGLSVYSF